MPDWQVTGPIAPRLARLSLRGAFGAIAEKSSVAPHLSRHRPFAQTGFDICTRLVFRAPAISWQ